MLRQHMTHSESSVNNGTAASFGQDAKEECTFATQSSPFLSAQVFHLHHLTPNHAKSRSLHLTPSHEVCGACLALEKGYGLTASPRYQRHQLPLHWRPFARR